MGAICSGKTNTAVDSLHSAPDQSDSGVQKYANHDVSAPAITTSNTNTGQGVEYISASETSLQKGSNSPGDIPDHTMPARLQETAAGTAMDLNTTEIKSNNPHLQTTFGNIEKAGVLFETEMEKVNSETYFDPILKVLKQDLSDIFEEFTSSTDRQTIGQFMAKIGLVDKLVRLYRYTIEDMYDAFTLDTLKDAGIEKSLLREIRKILWNFSDLSPGFQVAIAKPRLMFGFLAKDLQEMRKHEFDQIKESSFPFKSAVNIIHNCSRSANVTKDMYIVELKPGEDEEVSLQTCLIPFLKSSDTYVKLITLLSLAHIMDEKENKTLLGADKSLLVFLLDMIRKATSSQNRRHQGFSVEELLDGLSRLAKNDNNKGNIMNITDAYTMIKGIIERGDVVSETIAAVRTIWELIFDENNRIKVKNDTEFVEKLKDLKHSTTAELVEVASYACFVIDDSEDADTFFEDELKHNISDSMVPSKKKIWSKPSAVPPSTSPVVEKHPVSQEKPGHVMLSYNWAHQPVLLKVYDSLKTAGFPLWMDVYNMKGNVLDAMSQAVLDSEIVVICASEQYGNSANCRTEAEFARKKKKIIIPLMMQKKPDTWLPGWLDMLLGEKLYYKFYDIELDNQPAFEARMQEVVSAMGDYMRPGQPRIPPPLPSPLPDTQANTSPTTTLKQTAPSDISTTASKPKNSKQTKKTSSQIASQLDSWTEDDIETWLKDNRLHTFAGMKAITCEQLQFLVKISVKAPEFFYRSLKEEVGLKGLEQLMRVSNAIEKLV
ncbi:uncharacterized protein LOC110456578 [Mizuhopecten yessoensis]|uniref:TIR domain-containing protein n=1 Tax=Mizuhopecten yessoensis TaxID=6573 RepID=A0A210QAP3_MIZYE|nr:uncharacterized protein LOC110456578 [Mizuhopecten yessoensis]XP_021363073.1 uncharacterized protein LOC110456578 [Mizuhopecten yessoensis]XP_021363074.1 uncharacterized protein LOC110456578 [Mizuhopecten yessoensis]XP_021363075.1 uncharacterized protein LOC110456578 [Mizuhopecten yessoensis]OWF45802.1 hypothetical protein KP79_PYT13032 [Mizuhopecten yessoensis]